ncbi:MAG: serine protease [Phycisphaerales bacterium]|nr:serine protease [Phycisphaerales bacterium]
MPRAVALGALIAAAFLGGEPLLSAQTSAPPPPAKEDGQERSLQQRFVRQFDRKDYAGALDTLTMLRELRPRDPLVIYNIACARSMLGRSDEAAETLLDAISAGFADFHHLERDDHLAGIRGHPTFAAIMKGWRELLDARGQADLSSMREGLGEGYRLERDEALRLNFASAFDAAAFDRAKAEIRRTASWASPMFAEPPAAADRPPPWVSVVLPTPGDFLRLIRLENVGGIYDKDRRRLISRDIGPSLRHEFVHVLHWRHMERLGQTHPRWIQEGVASLVEDIDADGDAGLTLRPSWRTNIAKRLERSGRLPRWDEFFRQDDRRFVSDRPQAGYAVARAVFLFLAERGKLVAWYRAYTEGFAADPSGLRAVESAFGRPPRDVEREFRAWLRDLEEVSEVGRPDAVGLGVTLGPGSGDGPVVEQSVPPVGAGGRPLSPLRRGDVVQEVGGRPVATLDDLYRLLGDHEPGEELAVRVRRGGRTVELRVRLETGGSTPR